MAEVEQDFPLFPLGLVALPHELVPLHIFEERYKTMVGTCLEGGPSGPQPWQGIARHVHADVDAQGAATPGDHG